MLGVELPEACRLDEPLYSLPESRLEMLAMAAFTTWRYGGLMPHAKHGGIGVFALDSTGSKLDGTGLENEHIGHIQVALLGKSGAWFANAWRNGLASRPCAAGEGG